MKSKRISQTSLRRIVRVQTIFQLTIVQKAKAIRSHFAAADGDFIIELIRAYNSRFLSYSNRQIILNGMKSANFHFDMFHV